MINTTLFTIGEDTYTGGYALSVSEPTRGDLNAAGYTVVVSGDVEADAHLAGSTVLISGNVGDDLRATGATVQIEKQANIKGSAIIAAGSILIGPDVVLNEANLLGGYVNLRGTMNGKTFIEADHVILKGTVNGSLEIKSNSLLIDENAKINGDVTYDVQTVEGDVSSITSGIVANITKETEKVTALAQEFEKEVYDEEEEKKTWSVNNSPFAEHIICLCFWIFVVVFFMPNRKFGW